MRARKTKNRAVLAAVLFLSLGLASFGQSTLPSRIYGGSAGGLFPTGEFGEWIDRMGIGMTLFYGRRLSGSPFFVGGELMAQEVGHSLFAEVDSYNAIIQGLAFVRIRPPTGAVVPYLEALAGVTLLTTETDYGTDEWGDPIIEADSDDLTLAAGIGAGLGFCVNRRVSDGGSVHRTYLDFSVRYMTGGRANYSVVLADGSLLPTRSATSFVTAQIGLSWSF